MTDLIEPNLHPIFVHFTVGLLFTGAIALSLSGFIPGQARWRGALRVAGDWMLGLGLVAAIGAVIAGFEAYYSVAHDAPSHAAMTTHRNWALGTAALFAGLGVWRVVRGFSAPGPLFSLAALAAAGLLTVTAWWGGHLVFHHGVGVESLPEAHGEGHDHAHGPGEAHEADEDHHAGEDGGHAGHGDTGDHAHGEGEAAPAGSPQAAADAFLHALREGDEAGVRALLAGDVLILEGGGAERSLEEYAAHHMNSDMAFMQALSVKQLSRTVRTRGDAAWVASQYALRGTYRERGIAVKSQETLVLRREDEGWLIEHIHWSNSQLAEPDRPTETGAEPADNEHGDHEHGDHEH